MRYTLHKPRRAKPKHSSLVRLYRFLNGIPLDGGIGTPDEHRKEMQFAIEHRGGHMTRYTSEQDGYDWRCGCHERCDW